jgi:phenol 2-monooxygenase
MDLLDSAGQSQKALQACANIVKSHPAGSNDLVVLHPIKDRFEWTQLPSDIKKLAEMRSYGLVKKEDAYDIYGIAKEEGAIAVVRPDGYVGILCRLSAPDVAENYLGDCLVKAESASRACAPSAITT